MAGENSDPQRTQKILAIYGELCTSYRAIDDFRTKLLGLLPLATGTGIFLLVAEKINLAQPFLVPVGAFGFVITLGLFFYELYGIKKCTHLILAGIELEKDLKLGSGQFSKRPPGVVGLINEPLAAGVIYPAVLAAWTFIALAFLLPEAAIWWALCVFIAGFEVLFFYNLWLMWKEIIKWLDGPFVRLLGAGREAFKELFIRSSSSNAEGAD